MTISRYFLCFIFFSFLGWIWEICYCTYKNKHFENRGFLFGPVCPIYGVSVLVLMVPNDYIPFMRLLLTTWWKTFLFSMAVSALMEYFTSFYLEKRFNARWWDYSEVPLNINGRIALPITFAFGVAGVFIYQYLLPFMNKISAAFPNGVIELLGLILAGVLGADFAATEASLSTLLNKLTEMNEEFTEKGEELYIRLHEWNSAMSRHQKYVLRSLRKLGLKHKKVDLELGRTILELVKKR